MATDPVTAEGTYSEPAAFAEEAKREHVHGVGPWRLGLRRLRSLFIDTRAQHVGDARDGLAAALDGLRGREPRHDDVTFVIIDRAHA